MELTFPKYTKSFKNLGILKIARSTPQNLDQQILILMIEHYMQSQSILR